jgi:sugar phosphate isomerase/epimerase
MKLGVCTKLERIDLVKKFGFEYIEYRLSDTSTMSGDEISEARKVLDTNGMRAETFNLFSPPELNLSYAANEHEIRAYSHRAFSNAQKLGGEIIVVGSGKARRIPEECSFSEGRDKFKRTLWLVSDIAKQYGIKVALEPLNRNETNLINTLAEASELCDEVGHSNLGCLADLFHMYKNGEDVSEIIKYGDRIIHTHIARRNDMRGAPSIEDGAEDLIEFRNALVKIGYKGRISLEASSKNDFEVSVENFAKLADYLKIR